MKKIVLRLNFLLCVSMVANSMVAQTCTVSIKGSKCINDSLTAKINATNLVSLTWIYGQTLSHDQIKISSSIGVRTIAGGNGPGSAANQLRDPSSVCVDKNGNVYVTDPINNRVQKWTPGSLSGVTVAGGNGEGAALNQLSSPEGIFVDSLGNLYVADTHNWRVQRWSPGNKIGVTVAGGNGYGSNANQLYYPTGVFVDSNQNVYVSDYLNNRIQMWKPGAATGITVAGGNGFGSGANQLAYPKSIWLDVHKNIYIADYFNHRIQKWTPGATTGITVAGGKGSGSAANQLSYPAGIISNPAGTLFLIADSYNNRIQKWSLGAGSGTTMYGHSSFDSLSLPYSIALDVAGNKYVANRGNGRVHKYTALLEKDISATHPGIYQVVATTGDGCVDTSDPAQVYQRVQIRQINGALNDLCGGGRFTYTAQLGFEAGNPGTSFTWSVPNGCTILSGQGTGTIKLNIPSRGFKNGNLSVIATCCNFSDTFSTIISTRPNLSAIHGPGYIHANQKGLIYDVTGDSALHYTWTVPYGAQIVSGQGTPSVVVNWGRIQGNITVRSVKCADTAKQLMHVYFTSDSAYPQLYCNKDAPKISFPDKAPAPWAIDGKVDDWETILGPYTGNTYAPFYPPSSSGFNWAYDGGNGYFIEAGKIDSNYNRDRYDHPVPEADIRLTAFTNDDYNVYFYFRRIGYSDSAVTFYYFCDVNADGYLNYGEPVFSAVLTGNKISSLTLNRYKPDTTKSYISGKGNKMVRDPDNTGQPFGIVDGFPMAGTLEKVFNSSAIPLKDSLSYNEIFSRAVTEKGFGVEFAVPWKYLKNWAGTARNKEPLKPNEIFFYRVSTLRGKENYSSAQVMDNAGSCCQSVAKSGNVSVATSSAAIELIPNSLYRFKLSYTNLTNAAEKIQLEDIYYNGTRLGYNGVPKVLNIYPDYNCNGVVDPGESSFCNQSQWDGHNCPDDETIVVPGYGTACINVDVSSPYQFPPAGTFTFESSVLFNIRIELCDDAGGKVINPVGSTSTRVGGRRASPAFRDLLYSTGTLQQNELQVFPNPGREMFNIYSPSKPMSSVDMFDVYGRKIKEMRTINSNSIQISGVPSGIYFIKVTLKTGETFDREVIIEK